MNFPGVFFHGKANAVLPIICRMVPFFAGPTFCSRHLVIFETLGSLASLLRTGDRDEYLQFFKDVMLVVEASMANNISKPDLKVSLRCFYEYLSGLSSDPTVLIELPACNKPVYGFCIMINLTGLARWRPFATWIIKISYKCLTEGTLNVERLVNEPFVSAACKLLCYGDAALQTACFGLVRILVAVINYYDIIPCENMILSISIIVSEDEEGRPVFRICGFQVEEGIRHKCILIM